MKSNIKEVQKGLFVILRTQKDVSLGYAFLSSETLLNGKSEGWLPIYKGNPSKGNVSPSLDQKGEIKLDISYQYLDVLPLKEYEPISKILDKMEAQDMFEISKVSDQLESTATNLLKIFAAKGKVIPWLKSVVEKEIRSTGLHYFIF